MTLEDSIHSQRLRVLRDAERLKKVLPCHPFPPWTRIVGFFHFAPPLAMSCCCCLIRLNS